MRHRLRVIRAHALAWVGLVRLAVAIARGRVDQVWVGDSNSVFFGADRFPALGVGSIVERRWVWHLGPRLMFSVSRDGFKPGMHRAARLLSRLPHSEEVVWIFSFGEIDNRCHLAPRVAAGQGFDFVGRYVERIRALVQDLGVRHGVVMVPVPPATQGLFHESFPVQGTNEERLLSHRVLRERLLAEVSGLSAAPRIAALDVTDELSDDQGWYHPDLHTDGVHPNDAGREVAQAGLGRLLAGG